MKFSCVKLKFVSVFLNMGFQNVDNCSDFRETPRDLHFTFFQSLVQQKINLFRKNAKKR